MMTSVLDVAGQMAQLTIDQQKEIMDLRSEVERLSNNGLECCKALKTACAQTKALKEEIQKALDAFLKVPQFEILPDGVTDAYDILKEAKDRPITE